uniref:Major facilitator superfamily protein n=1 Tax=Heterorhabditis bacteriophora TaxID=37862 RepID=A0A1I7XGZ9_HETBA
MFRSVTHMNFASTVTELLIPQEVLPKGSLRLSMFYGLLTLGPQILLILNERMIFRYGAHGILSLSYLLSVLSSFIYILSSNAYITMMFMLIDSITVHSAGPLFNIIISDFIDDDAKRNTRRSPISSLVFSLNALFVKPAQSIAPVIVVLILNNYNYQEYLTSKVPSNDLVNAMRDVLFGIPLILGALQYLIFNMLLLATVVADQLRSTIPCSLLSFSMIPFATVSMSIGGISWFLPRKAFQLRVHNQLKGPSFN